jgi:formylglycine-generating enzyme required for sulfatase activity
MKNGCGSGTTAPLHVTSNISSAPFSLAGNVLEWVADHYDPKSYARSEVQDPAGPARGTARVLRGGSWMSEDIVELRSAYRTSEDPTTQMPDVGFRCVRSAAHNKN